MDSAGRGGGVVNLIPKWWMLGAAAGAEYRQSIEEWIADGLSGFANPE
jgi:hypothetical protein